MHRADLRTEADVQDDRTGHLRRRILRDAVAELHVAVHTGVGERESERGVALVGNRPPNGAVVTERVRLRARDLAEEAERERHAARLRTRGHHAARDDQRREHHVVGLLRLTGVTEVGEADVVPLLGRRLVHTLRLRRGRTLQPGVTGVVGRDGDVERRARGPRGNVERERGRRAAGPRDVAGGPAIRFVALRVLAERRRVADHGPVGRIGRRDIRTHRQECAACREHGDQEGPQHSHRATPPSWVSHALSFECVTRTVTAREDANVFVGFNRKPGGHVTIRDGLF